MKDDIRQQRSTFPNEKLHRFTTSQHRMGAINLVATPCFALFIKNNKYSIDIFFLLQYDC